MAAALAAQRATEVLRHVARHPEESFTLTALAARLEVSNAAMHAVLTALVESGFLERNAADKSFRLGPESVVLGSAARTQLDDVANAMAVAHAIADLHGLTTSVLALKGVDLLVLDGVESRRGRRIDLEIPGNRIPFAAPFGSVFAARLPPQAVVGSFQRAGIDPASPLAERYRAELDRVAARGWSLGTIEHEDDPASAWAALIGQRSRGDVATWSFLVDDLGSVDVVKPTAVVIECGPDAPDLAVAVTGFDRAMPVSDLERLAALLVAEARTR